MEVDLAQQAVADCQANPFDLWTCIRAIWALLHKSSKAEARILCAQFSARHGAGARGGEALLAAVQAAKVKEYSPGQTLVEEGECEDGLFVLLTGGARVMRLGIGEVAQLPAGSVVGEIAGTIGTARTATVHAEGPVKALHFETNTLAELTRLLPSVYVRLRETSRERMLKQLMGPGSIFGHLGDTARAAIYQQCLPITVATGTQLITMGEPGRAMCVIASGSAQVTHDDERGAHQVVAELGPGDVFGEMSLISGSVASANVTATSTLTLFTLDRRRYEQALKAFPQARTRVERLVKERLEVPQGVSRALPVVQIRHFRPKSDVPEQVG